MINIKSYSLKLTLLFATIMILSCNKTNRKAHYNSNKEAFSDGEYCAEIQYHNSKTGKHATYTLPVEVEDGELVKIKWTNGGWLDESHFTAPDILDGTAFFEDDRGITYEVELLEKGGDCN